MSLVDDTKRLSDLIDSVADGRGVDWDAAGAAPDDERMRRRLEVLRIIDGVAGVHRTELAISEAHERRRVARGASEATTVEAGEAVTDVANQRWGNFELLRKLGEGTFGEVYHARDTWLDHSVALKLLKPIVDRTRFLREARTLARIRHDNVVRIHGADEHNGVLGFWMDFIEGPTLADVVAHEGVRSPTEAAVIGQALCSAMAAVHATQIVHRDIKAQNVIRHTETGHIILMDFGAGEAMDAKDADRNPTGTPLYLAPELFDGRVATPETDIYALGVLLFHLVTRSYPVQGERMKDLRAAHRRGERHHLGDMRPDLPDAFVRVVETMIAPDRAMRYHSATEAKKALEDVVAPRPVVAAREEAVVQPPRSRTARERVYRSIVAVTIVIAWVALIGAFSTLVYQGVFGVSSDFNSDSYLRSTVGYGALTLLAPAIRLTLYGIAAMLVAATTRVFCRLVPAVGKQTARAGGLCHAFLERRELNDPTLMLQVTAGVGALALGVLAWLEWHNVTIFGIDVSTAPADRLAALQPGNEPVYDVLQRWFELLIFAYGLAVYDVYSVVRRTAKQISPATIAYVIVVPAVAVLLIRAMPFRVVYMNALRRVDYAQARCYRVGDKPGWVRLFCPDDNPPRVRDHRENDPLLHDRNVDERVFTPREEAAVFKDEAPVEEKRP